MTHEEFDNLPPLVFPQEFRLEGRNIGKIHGLSLRDYFAAMVLQGFAAGPSYIAPPLGIATTAYTWADAMLEARKL